MNFTKFKLEMKPHTLPNIFCRSWFDAFELDAHDAISSIETMFTMHKTHIQLWQIEADLQ